nr:putative internal virion protein [uncultured Mediterranean phage uvMED]|tara:strand:+ start:49 stop:570 length:522 start_codon:yes stop_codon:yes gene_type:complete
MSWQTAVVAAIGAAQYQQQGAIGKYNQQVQNRNAKVAEQEAQLIQQQAEFDIAQFDKKFKQVEGETKVNLAKSGVVQGSGTAYRIEESNALEAELQKNVIKYNANVNAARRIEEANFSRISGEVARQSTRLAQIGTLSTVGTSLLTMSNFNSPGSSQGQFGSTSNNSNFSNYS